MEIWEDIKGYKGLYQISNLGRIKCIRNKEKPFIMHPPADSDGYYRLKLTKNGKFKSYKVHRLVAQHFIPNPYNLPQVNHIDENKANNRMSNLEWCDHLYNSNYSKYKRVGINVKKHMVCCIETGKIYSSMAEAEKNTGAISSHISAVCKGTRITAGGYHWKYVDENNLEKSQ